MAKMKIQFLVLHLTVGLSFQSCTEGAKRDDGCVPEKCHGGLWVPHQSNTLSKCQKCSAYGDPHFEDFSKARFDWQDGCNYALVQEGSSQEPKFGVFMDLHQIKDVAHVGGPTTYLEDENTIVLHPGESPSKLFNVIVNGVSRPIKESIPIRLLNENYRSIPVYAWKHSSCVRLYGKTKILVELCESTIAIWAPNDSSYLHKWGGLCGSTDGVQKLVARDGGSYPNPGGYNKHPDPAFGNSWKTKKQTKSTCQNIGKRKRSTRRLRAVENLHRDCVNFINSSNSRMHHHHGLCLGVHRGKGSTGDDHLDACKYDLCIVANDREHEKAGFTVDKMLAHHTEIHSRIRIHNENNIETTGLSRPTRPRPRTRPHPTGTATHPPSFGFNVPAPHISHHGHFPSFGSNGGETTGLSRPTRPQPRTRPHPTGTATHPPSFGFNVPAPHISHHGHLPSFGSNGGETTGLSRPTRPRPRTRPHPTVT